MRPLVLLLALALAAAGAVTGQGLDGAGQEVPQGAGTSRARLGEPAGPPLSGERLEQLTQELASLMRCPVCQGLSVADSPVPLAAAMKNEVRELLAAGYDRRQVLTYFEQSYGEFVRLAPKARGFNLAVWVAPGAILLAGFFLILLRARAARAAAPAAAQVADPELEAYRERVRREVAQ